MQKNISKEEASRRLKQSRKDKAERVRVQTLVPNRGASKNKAAKSLMNRTREVAGNPYLARILAPEYASLGGVPDEFSGLTHCAKLITQHDLDFDSNGLSSGFITTSLEHHALLTKSAAEHAASRDIEFGARNEGNRMAYNASQMSDVVKANLVLFVSLSSPAHVIPGYGSMITSDVITVATPRFLPVAAPHLESDHSPVTQTWGNDNLGVRRPSIEVAAGNLITIGIQTTNTTASNLVLAIVTSVSIGSALVVTAAAANTGPQAAPTVAVPATHTRFYGVTCSAATVTWNLDEVKVIAASSGTTGPHDHSTYPIGLGDNSDWDAIRATSSDYRIVGMSAWIQYNGALTSGGKVALASIARHEQPAWSSNNYFDFNTLAAVPGAYSGPLIKGAYGYWYPTANSDLEWKPTNQLSTSDNFIAFSLVAHDTPAQNVTLRVCTIVEFQTHLQYLGPSPSEVDVLQIWDAFKRLAVEPHAMENDLHIRKILDFLEKGTKWGSRIALAAAPAVGMIPGVGGPLAGGALGTAALLYGANRALGEFNRDTRKLF